MENKPIKRHEALQPLSRHHHHGLVIATRLEKISIDDGNEWIQLMRDDLLDFWNNGGKAHFREEEDFLFPLFARFGDINRTELVEALLEHVKVRSLIQTIELVPTTKIDTMNSLGLLLRMHIKKEETVIFPLIEQTVPHDVLLNMSEKFCEMNLVGRTSYVRRKD